MSEIKLPPVPRTLLAFTDQDNLDEWETLCAIVRNYARDAVRLDREAAPDLTPVIDWLENGCDPQNAAKELRLYRDARRMRAFLRQEIHHACR